MYRPYSSSSPGFNPLGDVESTIRGLTQDLCTAFNTGNYDQFAACFAADGVFLAPHRESSQGRKAIENLLRQYGDLGYQDLRFETTRIDHSGDLVVETGRYTYVIQQAQNKRVDRGKFMRAWRRLGAWFILADSWNSDLPAGLLEMKGDDETRVA
jgi:uncharacterized protein (TIGR02246 family)